MRQCELVERYDTDLDMWVTKHIEDEPIYGEGLSDVFKSVGKKIFGRTGKKLAKSAAKKTSKTVSEYAGKRAGDKIVELLSKNKTINPSAPMELNIPIQSSSSEQEPLTKQEINDRVNNLLSGGKLRKMNFI